MTVTSEHTYKQKEQRESQRNRKQTRRRHPGRAQTKTQNQTMVLRHGGETLVCTGARRPRGLFFFRETMGFNQNNREAPQA